MKDFLDLIKDIWDFLRVRKKYWLLPLILTIVVMGGLILFSQGSVVAPLIYTIFQKYSLAHVNNLEVDL